MLLLLLFEGRSCSGSGHVSFRVYRVLVFPCGSGIGLEISDALKHLKEVELVGATSVSEIPTHCPYVFARLYDTLPYINEGTKLVDALVDIIRSEKIDVLFPALDDVTTFYADHRERLESTGARVLLPSSTAVHTARSKKLTYSACAGSVAVPEVFDDWAKRSDMLEYPVFMKPERGQGSQGARRIDNSMQLFAHAAMLADPLVTEYLPGREFTVDCFADRDSGLLFARARQRRRIRGGISVATSPIPNHTTAPVSLSLSEWKAGDHSSWVWPMALSIQRALKLHGVFFFQVKENRAGLPVLMEVAPRVAGAMALFRHTGVNFPLLGIYEAFRRPVHILTNDEQVQIRLMDKAYVNRFDAIGLDSYRAAYVDLDDTLVIRGRLNTQLVRLLFQCIDQRKRLVLVTRSRGEPMAVLAHYRLREVFDRVIHITAESTHQAKSHHIRSDMFSFLEPEPKHCIPALTNPADHIGQGAQQCSGPKAIFIDDSFRERYDVSKELGIPVFDCSMLNVLLDERPAETPHASERS